MRGLRLIKLCVSIYGVINLLHYEREIDYIIKPYLYWITLIVI